MWKCLAFAVLSLFVIGLSYGADDKKPDEPKVKNTLPPGWKALNLSAEQKDKVYAINKEYKVKIDELEAKIKALKTEEHDKKVAVLTAEQKEQLKKIAVGDDNPPKEKPPTDKDK